MLSGDGKISIETLTIQNHIPPVEMTEEDRMCRACFRELYMATKEQKEQFKKDEKEAKQKVIEENKLLAQRVPEYKKTWNKNGVIQFKSDKIAILQRMWGQQVEFIIAYDDITNE